MSKEENRGFVKSMREELDGLVEQVQRLSDERGITWDEAFCLKIAEWDVADDAAFPATFALLDAEFERLQTETSEERLLDGGDLLSPNPVRAIQEDAE